MNLILLGLQFLGWTIACCWPSSQVFADLLVLCVDWCETTACGVLRFKSNFCIFFFISCVASNFQVPWNFLCFFPKTFLPVLFSLKKYRKNMENFHRSLKNYGKHWTTVFWYFYGCVGLVLYMKTKSSWKGLVHSKIWKILFSST